MAPHPQVVFARRPPVPFRVHERRRRRDDVAVDGGCQTLHPSFGDGRQMGWNEAHEIAVGKRRRSRHCADLDEGHPPRQALAPDRAVRAAATSAARRLARTGIDATAPTATALLAALRRHRCNRTATARRPGSIRRSTASATRTTGRCFSRRSSAPRSAAMARHCSASASNAASRSAGVDAGFAAEWFVHAVRARTPSRHTIRRARCSP